MKFYITFGQVHVHSIGGKTFDRNCVAVIESIDYETAHNIAMDIFNEQFHQCLQDISEESVREFYPRGLMEVV